MLELLEIDPDEELELQLAESVNKLSEEVEDLNLLLLLNGPYDQNDCILEVHSGAGGTEACDWAMMLYRMYTRYCEKNNYKYEIIDYQDGEEAGIKSASIRVKGTNAYGYLKNEKGVHRLVRLSPFDSNNRRHTSFASVEVTPEIEQDNTIEIEDKDLKIDVYRSTGAGGQSVNTTDSAVRITHMPTGVVVASQAQRSQLKNREQAMSMLKAKLYQLEVEEHEKEMAAIRGEQLEIGWGSQIRSYVFHPYSMVKDHRTNYETGNVSQVMDGGIDPFIQTYLRSKISTTEE